LPNKNDDLLYKMYVLHMLLPSKILKAFQFHWCRSALLWLLAARNSSTKERCSNWVWPCSTGTEGSQQSN